ncbi:MAG TPA: ThuA domain-containing protein [Planctomycetaceae bacterium]|nr:ThuA domain-containing protein [Planctomycetaceae bacterium]
MSAVVLAAATPVMPADDAGTRDAGTRPRKLVLIAGPKSHGPVGNGIHDYPWSVKLLKVMLDNSNVADRVRVEYHLDGWPSDPRTLDDADAIMVISDGRDGELYEEAPHFQTPERAAAIQKQIDRGCGFLTFHFSTFAPDAYAKQILDWSGGYFDWETDGRREWHSAIRTLEADVQIASPAHPVARGVRPFRMNEEFYYNIRFDPGDKSLVPIWSVPALDGREPDGRIVAWAKERKNGGRGFGTTAGHFYDNWKHEPFRRMILNALVWAARAEVPDGGVAARFYTHAEITAALDGVEGAEPAVLDDRPIKALILTGAQHPAHKWQDTTPAIRNVLQRDPRITADVSTNIEDLATAKLAGYDLLVLNYCNWQQPGLSDAAKAGFVNFLKRGGGLVIVHFANGAFHFSLPGAGESDWPEYRRICRRVWDHTGSKSGHDAFGRFVVEVEQPDHPITRGLEAFETADELYFRQQGNEPIEVLARARSQVTGSWEPMAFVYEYGAGRVFQTVLGHAVESIENAGTAALVRRAAAWVARRKPMADAGLKATQVETPPAESTSDRPTRPKVDGHWGERAIGFRWTEDDSVDGRWNRTDVGPFLASIVPFDGGPVAKGLSIRVGEHGEAAVCYDTATGDLRAAWTGGFLRFGDRRFGLIEPPQIAGDVAFVSGAGAGRDVGPVRHRGLYQHGRRVVLEAELRASIVRESPWLETHDGQRAFSRTVEVVDHEQPFALLAWRPAEQPRIEKIDGVEAALVERDGRIAAVAVSGNGAPRLRVDGQTNEVTASGPAASNRFKLLYWSGTKDDWPRFAALVKASPPPDDLARFMQGGPPLWDEPLSTRGVRGTDEEPYVVDTLTLPFDNPWRALLFTSGHDFFSNGDAAVCTVHGDVWRVSGIDDGLENLSWRRFATGLFQPLGLKIVEDRVYVLGRDQITRLEDRDGNGEADFYGCLTNAWTTSPGGHDYVACLETDPDGNFYFVHATQGLLRVTPDGANVSVVATGFRNPNGLGVGPNGEITVAPQEGEWTPASNIALVRPDGHYGYKGPRVTPDRPLGYDRPLCWIPRLADNSSGGQAWVTSGRWGPLAGELLHFSYGQCRMMLVLREASGGEWQGGTVDFPLDFESGAMRGRFHPLDGQLYVTGLRGWTTRAVRDGCLQRVRYTDRAVDMPVALQTMLNGLAITFTRPLDRESAEDPGSFALKAWNYRYSEAYGSPELKPSRPGEEGRDQLDVLSATLLDDGRTVFLEVADLQPVNQLAISYTLRAADGAAIEQTISYTVHHVGPGQMDPARLVRRPVPGRLPDATVAALERGLLIRFRQRTATCVLSDASTARMAAFAVAAGTHATPFLEPGRFQATATGYIHVPLRGGYTFFLEGRGAASLEVNGEEVIAAANVAAGGPPVSPPAGRHPQETARRHEQQAGSPPARVRLHQGYNAVVLRYESPPEGDAVVRLFWEADGFAAEPVPPGVLFHDRRDSELLRTNRVRRGRELFATHNCFRCHALPEAVAASRRRMPELDRDTPNLFGLGARLRPEWVYRWILDPAALRNDATMPAVFDKKSDADRQKAADIAAWLDMGSGLQISILPAERPATSNDSEPGELNSGNSTPGDVRRGEVLYEDLGCIACHRFSPPPTGDEYGRVSLHYVNARFRTGALAAFLREPHRHYAWTAMPDFRLDHDEAGALAAYLRSRAEGRLDEGASIPAGDTARGARLFESEGCNACHNVDRPDRRTEFHSVRPPDRRTEFHSVRPSAGRNATPSFTQLRPSGGCLLRDETRPPGVPRFALDDPDRQALAAFLAAGGRSLAHPVPAEDAARLIASLRCAACHHRDGETSPRGIILADESERGRPPEVLPDLTWAGEKLRPEWTRRHLAGEIPERIRPWLTARMPAFPAHARSLADGLAAGHGLLADDFTSAAPQPDLAAVGLRLVQKDAGLDCRQCHGVGPEPPQGDEQTRIAPGVNFALARERLSYGFYRRFVLDPPRYDAGTKMPKLTVDGRTTRITSVYDGDADRQFLAIWHFVQSVQP